MRIFFQINDHPKEGKNSDSHGPKVIFLGTSGKQDYERHTALRNLSYLEETPEAPYYQGMLNYIKELATYMSDLAAILLGFASDVEASALVLGEELERILIRTEAAHGRLV